MAGIDSLLKIAQQQGADELRLGVDRPPRMFARGVPKRLSIPATSEETLRVLLGELLGPAREAELREAGMVEASYDAGRPLGAYRVTFTTVAAGGFEVVFFAAGSMPLPAAVPSQVDRVALSGAVDGGATSKPEPSPSVTVSPSPPISTDLPQLTAWVRRAAARRASDLHLAEGECPCIRVDGVLERLDAEVIDDMAAVVPLCADLATRLMRGEGIDMALEIAGVGRVRVHMYATSSGRVAAVRLLPRAAPSFAALDMPIAFDDLVELPHGLVLVCGAAGSGKSTTLAALAHEALRRRSLLLMTLEDPIEYGLSAPPTSIVRRRQIGRDVPDFASGLRDALRADPDMLLLGELRDPETIALALSAAETGHLVLASMHSRSAASAIERIVDACPAEQQLQVRLQLAESLRAVVAQRLLRRRHGEGRIPCVEVLRATRAVASLIREAKTAQIASVLQSARREGMLALERCLADRVQAGEIHQQDAYAAANDPEALSIFLTR